MDQDNNPIEGAYSRLHSSGVEGAGINATLIRMVIIQWNWLSALTMSLPPRQTTPRRQ